MEPNTVRLRSETWDELAEEADKFGHSSRAEYIRHLIQNRGMITGASTADIGPNTPSNTADYETIMQRLDNLEAAVEELQQEQQPPMSPTSANSASKAAQGNPEPSGSGGLEETLDSLPKLGVEPATTGEIQADDLTSAVRDYIKSEGLPPKTPHGRSAVIETFRVLRVEEELATSDLQEAVYEPFQEEWPTAQTMWNAINRHLEDVPGIEKAGGGAWVYIGDDTVRAQL